MVNTRNHPGRLGSLKTKQNQEQIKSKNTGKRSSFPPSQTSRLLDCYIPNPSGVGKKQSKSRWKGSKFPKLPQFARPQRKVIAGVPTLVLELLPAADSENATGGRNGIDEIPIDSESDARVTADGDHGPNKAKPIRDPYEQDIDVFPDNTNIEGPLRASDPKEWEAYMTKFIRGPMGKTYKNDPAKHPGGWVGKKPLGQGGQGMTGMWERVDENGRVHQIAVKQVVDRYWQREPPRDVPAMKAIKRWSEKYREKNTGCVDYIDYVRYRRRQVHRIYMEYCPYGDLWHLRTKYQLKRRLLPELFIWDLFHELAIACRTLSQIPSRGGSPGYELVHLDLKPGNVFLAPPRSWEDGGIPLYATARLGDFGHTTCTSQSDPGNPRRYIDTGTYGYRPFEQQDFHSSSETEPAFLQAKARWQHLGKPRFRVGSWTNIWGIGAVVFEMMMFDMASNHLYPAVPGHTKTFFEGTNETLIKSTDNPHGYSEELVDLVKQCLAAKPDERPKVDELMEKIQRGREPLRERLRKRWESRDADEELEILEEFGIPWETLSIMESRDEWQGPFQPREEEEEE